MSDIIFLAVIFTCMYPDDKSWIFCGNFYNFLKHRLKSNDVIDLFANEITPRNIWIKCNCL